MSILTAQMSVLCGQPKQNLQRILSLIEQGRAQKADLLVFPELCISGAYVGDLLHSREFVNQCQEASFAIAARAEGISVVFSNLYQDEDGNLYNQVYLAQNGHLRPVATALAPAFIPNAYGEYVPSKEMELISLTIDGREQRIGFLLGDYFLEDMPAAVEGADLLIDLSQRPIFFDRDLTPPLALDADYLLVNACGMLNTGKSCYLLAGNSRYYDHGRLLSAAPYFAEGLYNLFTGESSVALPDEDTLLREALVQGAGTFLKQINCHNAVIGLSGGIDSALAACVYSQAIGSENVYLISMPTQYNSSTTKSLAAELARTLGCPFSVIPVEDSARSLQQALEQASFQGADGYSCNLRLSDLGWENLMARERGRVLAAAASASGGIFTCNGNKAELTVGYATFYGDLAGGFAAQADLWKYQVYQASRAFQALLPDTPMDKIASIRPSAELSWNQSVDKGLGDPLQYAYHDYLLRYWVEGQGSLLSALEAYAANELDELIGCQPGLSKRYFPTAAEFTADLERWWKQYRGIGIAKRIQAPPLLALSSHPFGEPLPQMQSPVWFDPAYEQLKEQLCR